MTPSALWSSVYTYSGEIIRITPFSLTQCSSLTHKLLNKSATKPQWLAYFGSLRAFETKFLEFRDVKSMIKWILSIAP